MRQFHEASPPYDTEGMFDKRRYAWDDVGLGQSGF